MAEQVFHDIKVNVVDMPVGCMVAMSGDGRQIIPIINLDIEVDTPLRSTPPKLPYPKGKFDVGGEVTCYFENEAIIASMTSNWERLRRDVWITAIGLGDIHFRTHPMSRKGRKWWRKSRKLMAADVRRFDARELRSFNDLPTF